MKRRITLCVVLIIIFLCMLPLISLATNTTEIKIMVYEIKVNCEGNGSYTVNQNDYVDKNNFYVGHDGGITISIKPQQGYTLENVNCEPKCNFTLDKDKIVITNVADNITVNIKFKSNEFPGTGIETEEKITQKEKHCCWICWIILFIILYIIFKLKDIIKKCNSK